jgi:acetyl-CoA acetyltransferase family protein
MADRGTRCRLGAVNPNGNVYLVSAARTPIGRFGGALAGTPAVELGGVAIRAAVERSGLVFDLPLGEDRGTADVGTVTAGNAPGITDGAAATLVASERAVERHGLTSLARIIGYAQAEVAPKWLFLAPVQGVRRLLDRIELPIETFDLVEINEAFAAQTLADGRELGFDWDKVNVNGGAIALGHPIGASGARVVATLLHELRRREGRYGLATLCLGGGGSVAMAFERV